MALSVIDFATSFGYSTTLLDYFASISGITPTINSTGGRDGAPSLRTVVAGSAPASRQIAALKTSGATKAGAFAYKTSALPAPGSPRTIFEFREGGAVQVDLRLDDLGRLFFTRAGTTLAGTTTAPLVQSNVVIHIQPKVTIDPSSGSVDLRINGSTLALGGGVGSLNTRATATSSIDACAWCFNSSGLENVTADMSHPVIGNDWIGDARVNYFPVNNVGNSSQWSRSAGSNNYENVDETTPNPGDYNFTDTVGNKDTFPQASLPSTANVIAVGPIGLFNKQDAGDAECCFVIRQGGTDYDSADFGANFSPPFGSNQYFQEWVLINPATGLQFSASEFNGGETGYKRTS